ncbi:MAG: Hsp20/alpha crystallin family protein, partial [Cyclobacteriaceae bacterium]
MITRFVTPGTSLLNELFSQNYPNRHNQVNQTPKYNIKENSDEYKLELAVPGYKKEDFHINVEDKQLIIKVDLEMNDEQKYLQREFTRYNFEKK